MTAAFAADADGRITHFDDDWFAFTGASRAHLYGSDEAWLEHIHPEDRDRVASMWRMRTLALDRYAIEFRLRSAEGTYHTTLGVAEPLRDDAGRIAGWHGWCVLQSTLAQGEPAR